MKKKPVAFLTKAEIKQASLAQTAKEKLRGERRLEAASVYDKAVLHVQWLASQAQFDCAPISKLVELGNLIASTLARIVDQEPGASRYVAGGCSAWPVSISDSPHLDKALKLLLKDLGVGKRTGEPFDAIRATRHKSPAKALAIEVALILDTIREYRMSKEDVRFFRHYGWLDKLPPYFKSRKRLLSEINERLGRLAGLIGVEPPFRTTRQLLRYVGKLCLPKGRHVRETSVAEWTDAAVTMLWMLTNKHPEQCSELLTIIAKSKARVKKPRAADIKSGIKFELKQAFAALTSL
ncbi:MAG: hypothetical protein ABMA13_00910 [Chthoniobacteraceae bacterium]